jgi:gas vesicle protein
MVNQNHNNEQAYDTPEPWGPLAGMLAGLLIGGLAGAVAMLFMAPQSGKRTRAKIQRASNELREQAADTMEDAMEQARAKTHQVAQGVRKQADAMEERGQAVLDGQK